MSYPVDGFDYLQGQVLRMNALRRYTPKIRWTDGPLLVVVFCLAILLPSARAQAPDASLAQTAVRGIVKAESEATISSELVAKVARLPFKEGQSFKAGDVIVEFDCRRYKADLRAAEADVEAAKIKVRTNEALDRHAAVGADELAISRVKLQQAEATAEALRIKTDQCIVSAPFDGRVVEWKINQHEIAEAAAPLIHIVNEGDLELELIVPSSWLVWLNGGDTFSFHIDELKRDVKAQLMFVGATVDPISRTALVSAKIIDANLEVLPGMSGTATFTQPNG